MRVKRGVAHVKRRKNVLSAAKGYRWGRKNQIRKAKTAITRAGRHAYKDRRLKKRDARALWQVKINAAARLSDMSYSQFMGKMIKAKIALDRKVLAQIAMEYPEVFAALVAKVKDQA